MDIVKATIVIFKPAEVVIEQKIRDVSIATDRFVDVKGGRTSRGVLDRVDA